MQSGSIKCVIGSIFPTQKYNFLNDKKLINDKEFFKLWRIPQMIKNLLNDNTFY